MITHKIGKKVPKVDPTIDWFLALDEGVLRLTGSDGERTQTVFSIYRSGVSYRHRGIKLNGIELNNNNAISEFKSPGEAHAKGH